MGTNNVRRAAIISADTGDTWAESSGGMLEPGEGPAIVALFKDPGQVLDTGVLIGGEKYAGVHGTEKAICATRGANGVGMSKTAQTIVIGYYEEGQAPCSASLTVQNVADSLIEDGHWSRTPAGGRRPPASREPGHASRRGTATGEGVFGSARPYSCGRAATYPRRCGRAGMEWVVNAHPA